MRPASVAVIPASRARWEVLAGAWAVYAAFGMLVSATGALVPEIQSSLAVGDTGMGLVLGAWQLVYIGASIPAGRFIDRIGVRRALMVSMTIMVASGLARAAAVDGWTLFGAVAFFGLGAPIISVGAPKVAASLFEGKDRRVAVGLYSTAPAIGGIVGLVLPGTVIGPLVEGGPFADRWRSTMIVLSALAALGLAAWIATSRGLDRLLAPGHGPPLSAYLSLARRPVVRLVLSLSVLTFFVAHGIGQWMVAIVTSTGWSAEQAGLWAALGSAVGLVGSFAVPRLATPERRPALMSACLVIGAVSAGFLVSRSSSVLLVAVVLTSLARVSIVPILVMTMMDHPDVGPANIAAATGLFFTTAQIGGVAGPAVTGALSELSGGFGTPLVVHSGVMLSTVAVIFAGRRAIGGN